MNEKPVEDSIIVEIFVQRSEQRGQEPFFRENGS